MPKAKSASKPAKKTTASDGQPPAKSQSTKTAKPVKATKTSKSTTATTSTKTAKSTAATKSTQVAAPSKPAKATTSATASKPSKPGKKTPKPGTKTSKPDNRTSKPHKKTPNARTTSRRAKPGVEDEPHMTDDGGAGETEVLATLEPEVDHAEPVSAEDEEDLGGAEASMDGISPPEGKADADAEAGQDMEDAEKASRPSLLQPTAPERNGMTIPEQFYLLFVENGWDDRQERAKPGMLGQALTAALLLDLALHRNIQLQADKFVVKRKPSDAAFAPFVQRLEENAKRPAAATAQKLSKQAHVLARPFKERLASGPLALQVARTALLQQRWRLDVRDAAAVERFRQRLIRGLAGGGPLDAQDVLLLALVDAAGRLGDFVPTTAIAYNRKRIHGLVAGRDRLDYRTDNSLKAAQRDLVDFALALAKPQ